MKGERASPSWQQHLALGSLVVFAVLGAHALVAQNGLGWYSDEGTHLAILRSLLQGRWDYLGIQYGVLLAARQPLFYLLFLPVARSAGLSLEALRGFSLAMVVVTGLLLYAYAWQAERNPVWGALAAVVYALVPRWVLYQHLAFTYDLVAVWVMVAALALERHSQTGSPRALYAGLGALTLAWLTDLTALFFLLPVGLYLMVRTPRTALLWGLVTAGVTLGLWAWMYAPHWVWLIQDVRMLAWERAGNLAWYTRLLLPVYQFAALWNQDVWWALGWLGWLLRARQGYALRALGMWATAWWLLGARVTVTGLGFYYLLPWLPFLALGVAAWLQDTLTQVITALLERLRIRPLWTRVMGQAAVLLMFTLPLTVNGASLRYLQGDRLPHAPLAAVLLPEAEAQATLKWLAARVRAEDLVVTSPTLAWAVPARTTDFQIAVLALGEPTPHFPTRLPRERWAYELRYPFARYAVMDRVWLTWGRANIPAVERMSQVIEATWVPVARFGEVTVYCNPRQDPNACR